VRINQPVLSTPKTKVSIATHLAVSTPLSLAADLAAHHFRDPMACFSDLVVHSVGDFVVDLVAGLVVVRVAVGRSCRMLALARGNSVVELFVLDLEVAVLRSRSCRVVQHAVVFAPICLVGRNSRRHTARSRPGRSYNHNIVGHNGRHSPRVVVAVPAVDIPGRNTVAAAVVASGRRVAVVGMPSRRYRMYKPQTRPIVKPATDGVFVCISSATADVQCL
jgi:hypothetical protein